MAIDWGSKIRRIVDLGSESYGQRQVDLAIKIGAVVLFLIVAWKLLK